MKKTIFLKQNIENFPHIWSICRAQLAEWRASKGKGGKMPVTVSADSQSKTAKLKQTVVKEPVKSFWAAIAEEDEQGLFRDTVDKTLRECLHSIKEVRYLISHRCDERNFRRKSPIILAI